MTTAVKRACDACHRRKVKCDGTSPCRNCNTATLNCTYNAVPQKKGPKGSRAKVISALREDQKLQSLSAQVQSRMNGIAGPQPPNPSLAPVPGLLTSDLVRESLDFFFANMYPQIPIISRQRLEQQLAFLDQSPDTYCLLTSLSAFTMLQPGMGIPGGDPYGLDSMPGANILSCTVLLEETIRVRKGFDYIEPPSFNTLCTSYFLFACHYAMDMHDKAWFHLREAATMIHMIGMNREEVYAQLDPVESACRRRLYWLIFVAERAYALQRNRPLTLQATINPPTPADDPTDPYAQHLNNFSSLVNLFRPFDDAFLATWNKIRNNWPSAHLDSLKKQMEAIMPSFLSYGDSQLGDLGANRQWIETLTWHLRMNNGNVNMNGDESLVYQQYAANLTSSLSSVASSLQGSPDMTATSLLLTIFDVARNLAEALALHPASRDPFTRGPREQLTPLLNILSLLRNGDHRFMPLLLNMAHEVLPKLINPMLQNVPDSVAMNACNVDIFDGFGNGGMAQPSAMMDTYEKKYTPPESNSSQGGGSASGNDMHSPFVSSPMSPVVEVAHGMPNNYNPISEAMMNQMGQPTAMPQVPNSNPSPTSHLHTPISPMPTLMQNGINAPIEQQQSNLAQNFGQHFNQSLPFISGMGGQSMNMNGNNMMPRQMPNRANSFALNPNPQLRTIGDFQALQRANSEMSTMGSMGMNNGLQAGSDMDFAGLR
ncbi:hypothetical protein N0V82_005538 [Gnomoniopsis sp. IMI 355080]|nr:hypothetical protein N0V82_005538 [Gnomoniopsis sp. IMI 355080]